MLEKFSKPSNLIRTATIIFLALTLTIPFILLPTANAHTPPWKIQPYLKIHVAPNPVGLNQPVYIVMFTTWALPGADYNNDIRFHDFKLTITKPNNTTEVIEWAVVPDSGGSVFTSYTPDQLGTYKLLLEYPGQTYTWNLQNTPVYSGSFANGIYENDTILSASQTATFTVQQEPVGKLPDIPLPTEYWTRPIDAQNFLWGEVSSNWLSGAADDDRWQKDGNAPKSAHIMWSEPIQYGGLLGGTLVKDANFYGGFSYETRFNDPIVIAGMLFYRLPLGHAGTGGGYRAVDLRTGQEIWYRDDIDPTKGQLFSFQMTPNQHGVVGGLLWQTVGSTWIAYDAFTGKNAFNLTGVPSGTEVYARGYPPENNNGMIVRYVFNYNRRWMALWNNTLAVVSASQVFNSPGWRPNGNNIDASKAYSWNVSLPNLPGSQSPRIVGIIPGDIILGSSADVSLASNWKQTPDPWTMWAISDRPESRGQLLWIKNYPAPPNNVTRMLGHQPVDPVNRVFLMTDRETGKRYGYSIDTGDLLWGPVGEERDIQYYSARQGFPAYGILYVSGYGGEIIAYSTLNGTSLWKYNNTDSGTGTPWGLIPTHISAIANGVVYAFSGEHSPNKPLYHGYQTHAIDAFTGEKLWTLKGWAASGLGTTLAPIAIADGYLVYWNLYDGRVYAVGKGPSATSVTIQNDIITHGDQVIVKGTVMDISAGTKQDEQAARFPSGVPAVSEESQSAWMEYVYMQQPRPAATGVEVTLTVVDPNNNIYDIGTVTSDTTGTFKLLWQPEVPGEYTVIAQFSGSESYWPSYAETFLFVKEAPETPPTPQPTQLPPFDMYILYATIAIIAAIVVATLLLRRKS